MEGLKHSEAAAVSGPWRWRQRQDRREASAARTGFTGYLALPRAFGLHDLFPERHEPHAGP
jgi:hypothetical protein